MRDEPGWAERAERFSAKVRDVTEVLAEAGPQADRKPLDIKVAYHDACHLAHAQGVREPPRELLRSIPGLELVEPAEWEICCGSAGIYNLVKPEPAAELGERKARNLIDTGAEVIAAANPGLRAPDRRPRPPAGPRAGGGPPDGAPLALDPLTGKPPALLALLLAPLAGAAGALVVWLLLVAVLDLDDVVSENAPWILGLALAAVAVIRVVAAPRRRRRSIVAALVAGCLVMYLVFTFVLVVGVLAL